MNTILFNILTRMSTELETLSIVFNKLGNYLHENGIYSLILDHPHQPHCYTFITEQELEEGKEYWNTKDYEFYFLAKKHIQNRRQDKEIVFTVVDYGEDDFSIGYIVYDYSPEEFKNYRPENITEKSGRGIVTINPIRIYPYKDQFPLAVM